MDEPASAGIRTRRRVIGAIAVGLVAVIVVVGAIMDAISRPTLEGLLNRAIGPASGGFYAVTLEGAQFSLWSGSLTLSGVTLAPAGDGGADVPDPAIQFTLSVDEVETHGVSLLGLVLRTGFHAASVDIVAPRVEAQIRRESAGSPPGDPREPDTRSQEQRVRAALTGMAELEVGRVSLRDVSFRTTDTLDGESTVWQVGDLDLEFDGLHVHPTATLDEIRALFSEDIRLAASTLELDLASGSRLAIDRIEVGSRSATVSLEGAHYTPQHTPREYLSRSRVAEPDRIEASVERIEITQFVPGTFIAGLYLELDTITLAGFAVDILHDRHKPRARTPASPAVFPHDALRDLGWRVSLRQLRLEDGAVTYGERAPDAARTGSIAFSRMNGTLGPIVAPATPGDAPLIAEITTVASGAAPVTIRIEMPLGDPAPTMRSEGRVGSFDPAALNGILVPLEGLQIADGRVSQMWYSFEYRPGSAAGSLTLEYDGLGVRLVNKDTGERNLGQRLVSLAAGLKVRSSNRSQPGKPARSIPVDYRVDRNSPFFKVFWEPIREGLLATIRR